MNRTRFLVAVAALAAVAAAAPGLGASAGSLVGVGVFTLLYLVMLGIDPRGLGAVFTQRRLLAAAVTINFVVLPVVAWGLGAAFLADQPDLRIGLLLFLVTPCIGWYLIFTDLAGGDTQLGVALLGINLGLQILLLPVYLQLFAGQSATVDLATIIGSAATYLVLPFALAMGTRHLLTTTGTSVQQVSHRLRIGQLKTVTLMALRLPYPQTALLVFTTSARNSEASLAIAATAFASPLVALSVVIGPAVELPLLIVFTRLLLRLRPPS